MVLVLAMARLWSISRVELETDSICLCKVSTESLAGDCVGKRESELVVKGKEPAHEPMRNAAFHDRLPRA
jgi:hypothetical protein